jgi:DNA polymerase I-like protein with 3'-5' exonuclease and polymerase domains
MNVIIDALVYPHEALQQAALRDFVKKHGRVEGYAVVGEEDRLAAALWLEPTVLTTPDRLPAWNPSTYGQRDIWMLVEFGVPLTKAREAIKKYGDVGEASVRKWQYQEQSNRARNIYNAILNDKPWSPEWLPCPYTPPTTHTDRDYRHFEVVFDTRPYIDQPIALDFETEGEYPFMRPISYSFSVKPGEAYYINIEPQPGVEASPYWKENLQRLVNGPWVAHNARFEMHCLETLEVPYTPPHDTMILNWLASEPRGLKEWSREKLGEEMRDFKEVAGGREWSQVPLSEGLEYACKDADMTLRCWEHHTFGLKVAGRDIGEYHLYQQERALLPVLVAMERRGFAVDMDGLWNWHQEIQTLLQELSSWYPCTNLNSGQQMSKLLFEKEKLDPIKWAAVGYSTDDETLRSLLEQHEDDAPRVLVDLLVHREFSKLDGTYALGLQTAASLNFDDRIHPQYDGTGTKTGRLSSKAPNGQNIPREARKYLVATKGHRLFAADYSQIELRIIAHLSQDERMLETFHQGISPHLVTLKGIFGYDHKDQNPRAYTLSKNINFGVPYGTSADTLIRVAREGGIRLVPAEAEEFIRAHKALYPRFWEWRAEMVEAIRQLGGWATDMDGHTAYYPDLLSDDPSLRGAAEREAVNKLIQGPAGRGAKRAMVWWYSNVIHHQWPLLANVHDEIVGEAPEVEAPSALTALKMAMEATITLSIPVEVEGKTGRTWYDLK